LSLCNPQSEKSCDISFISVKLPKLWYSQYTSVMTKPEVWYQYLQLTTIMFLFTNKNFLGYVLVQEVQSN